MHARGKFVAATGMVLAAGLWCGTAAAESDVARCRGYIGSVAMDSGRSYLEAGRYRDALGCFEAAAEVDELGFEAYKHLGLCYALLKEHEKSAVAVLAAYRCATTDAERAEMLDAFTVPLVALMRDPRLPDPERCEHARYILTGGRHPEDRAAAQAVALEICSANQRRVSTACRGRTGTDALLEGVRLQKQGKCDEAIPCFWSSATESALRVTSRIAIAQCQRRHGRLFAAVEEYDAVRQLPNGDVPSVREELGQTSLAIARDVSVSGPERCAAASKASGLLRGHNDRRRANELKSSLCTAPKQVKAAPTPVRPQRAAPPSEGLGRQKPPPGSYGDIYVTLGVGIPTGHAFPELQAAGPGLSFQAELGGFGRRFGVSAMGDYILFDGTDSVGDRGAACAGVGLGPSIVFGVDDLEMDDLLLRVGVLAGYWVSSVDVGVREEPNSDGKNHIVTNTLWSEASFAKAFLRFGTPGLGLALDYHFAEHPILLIGVTVGLMGL